MEKIKKIFFAIGWREVCKNELWIILRRWSRDSQNRDFFNFALSGFYGLRQYGKPIDDWENTTHLITEGVFHYIRHPLYASLILLNLGIFLKNINLLSTVAYLISTGFLVAASKVEEKENHAKFGSA